MALKGITKEDAQAAATLLETSRDEIAQNFKDVFKGIILEADEWRPLADHVLDLIALGIKNSEKE